MQIELEINFYIQQNKSENTHYRGPIEKLLMQLNQEHRFIIRGNYKIIYKILNSTIYITDVFDTRQDPKELKTRNK